MHPLPRWIIWTLDFIGPVLLLFKIFTPQQLEMILLTQSFKHRNLAPPFVGTNVETARTMIYAVNNFVRRSFGPNVLLRVLEPSCGDGALLDTLHRMPNKIVVTAIETDSKRLEHLYENKRYPFEIDFHNYDYMRYFRSQFEVVIMNPPYANRAYIKHVYKAITCDVEQMKGLVVALVPESVFFMANRDARFFRKVLRRGNAKVDRLGAEVCCYPVPVCMITYET